MKTIIAGGRDYKFDMGDSLWMRKFCESFKVTEVVCGGAKGADEEGKKWSEGHMIPVKMFYANWDVEGKSAGHKRNRKMAEYADALVIFPGGKGSMNMFLVAIELGLKIFDPREFYPELDMLEKLKIKNEKRML